MNLLPGEPNRNARDPRGIRLGVQEMTRFGMGPAEMERIGGLMHDCIVAGRDVAHEAKRLRDEFPEIRYGFGLGDLTDFQQKT
jgi:glycine hydroxymethyltransferase